MDIDGAKALKERLARTAWVKSRPAPVEVPDGAPPVYHWFSVGRNADASAPSSGDAVSVDGSSTLGSAQLGLPPAS
jgi:hypothetical protein